MKLLYGMEKYYYANMVNKEAIAKNVEEVVSANMVNKEANVKNVILTVI